MIALIRLRKQDHVIQPGFALPLQGIVGRKINLATVDGLDLLARLLFNFSAGVAKFRNAAHHTMIGDCNGRHVQFGGPFDHIDDVGRSVQKRIFGVIV